MSRKKKEESELPVLSSFELFKPIIIEGLDNVEQFLQAFTALHEEAEDKKLKKRGRRNEKIKIES